MHICKIYVWKWWYLNIWNLESTHYHDLNQSIHLTRQFSLNISASHDRQPINTSISAMKKGVHPTPKTTLHLASLIHFRPILWYQPWPRATNPKKNSQLPALLTTPSHLIAFLQQLKNHTWIILPPFKQLSIFAV